MIDELQSSVLLRVRFEFFARLQLGGVQVVIVNSSSPWLLQSTIWRGKPTLIERESKDDMVVYFHLSWEQLYALGERAPPNGVTG